MKYLAILCGLFLASVAFAQTPTGGGGGAGDVTTAQLQAATNTTTLAAQGLALETELVASTNTATLSSQGLATTAKLVASTNTTTLHGQGLALSTELVAATNTATLAIQGVITNNGNAAFASAQITNAAFLGPIKLTNAASGTFTWIGVDTTNAIVVTNVVGQPILKLQPNGAVEIGTNNQFVIDASGNLIALTLNDLTVGNVSTSAHGFVPKGDANAAHYLDGTGAYSTPAGGGSSWQRQTINGGSTGNSLLTSAPYGMLSGTTVSAGFSATINDVTQPAASGGYLSNLTFFINTAIQNTTNLAVTVYTNVLGTTPLGASALTCTLKGETLINNTNDVTHACPLPASGGWAIKILPSSSLSSRNYTWSVEWWHQ